jgi:hypothetical protein
MRLGIHATSEGAQPGANAGNERPGFAFIPYGDPEGFPERKAVEKRELRVKKSVT